MPLWYQMQQVVVQVPLQAQAGLTAAAEETAELANLRRQQLGAVCYGPCLLLPWLHECQDGCSLLCQDVSQGLGLCHGPPEDQSYLFRLASPDFIGSIHQQALDGDVNMVAEVTDMKARIRTTGDTSSADACGHIAAKALQEDFFGVLLSASRDFIIAYACCAHSMIL